MSFPPQAFCVTASMQILLQRQPLGHLLMSQVLLPQMGMNLQRLQPQLCQQQQQQQQRESLPVRITPTNRAQQCRQHRLSQLRAQQLSKQKQQEQAPQQLSLLPPKRLRLRSPLRLWLLHPRQPHQKQSLAPAPNQC